MCLYPKFIRNRKYYPTKKNGYNPPICKDKRVLLVPVGCGNCIECRKQKAREWQVRLNEELKANTHAYFVTLTFSVEALSKLCEETQVTESNAIATIAVRRFLERWRKKYKKSIKHWLISELGHSGTERIHLHGLLFNESELNNEEIQSIWQYGWTFTGNYCNENTINYIVKYVTKIDTDHKGFKSVILASAGLGKQFLKKVPQLGYNYKQGETKEYYKLRDGTRIALPIYYRNHIWNEQEREQIWLDRLDKGSIYVRGIEIPNVYTEDGQRRYNQVLRAQQEDNIALGYGSDENEWKEKDYNITFKMLNKRKK